MTPKEKAQELFDKYWTLIAYKIEGSVGRLLIKQCALIAVDEILSVVWYVPVDIEYWQEVKKEIELL
jgi:hypothetical protein